MMHDRVRTEIAYAVAEMALEIGAIKLSPERPFQWASGYFMPVYNDNRMFLFHPDMRRRIGSLFERLMTEEGIPAEVIAGTSTAGISPGTTLADRLDLPFIYVRETPKDHGLKNQIEGIDAGSDLQRKQVVLIEDLISFGGSSVRAVRAIRDANGACNACLSIFTYGFSDAESAFATLDPYCSSPSLLTYDLLLEVAREKAYFKQDQEASLVEWRHNPKGWGEARGFPRVVKTEVRI